MRRHRIAALVVSVVVVTLAALARAVEPSATFAASSRIRAARGAGRGRPDCACRAAAISKRKTIRPTRKASSLSGARRPAAIQ